MAKKPKKPGRPTYRKLELRVKELEDDLRISKHIIVRFVKTFGDLNMIMSDSMEDVVRATQYLQ